MRCLLAFVIKSENPSIFSPVPPLLLLIESERTSMATGKRLYLVMAADSAKPADDVLFTDKVRK